MTNNFKKALALVGALAVTAASSTVYMVSAESNANESTKPVVSSDASESTDEATTGVAEEVYGGAKKSDIAAFGDVNKDGAIDAKDATEILKYYAESIFGGDDYKKTIAEFEAEANSEKSTETTAEATATETTIATATKAATTTTVTTVTEATETTTAPALVPSYADVNGDGHIDAKDATSILIYYAYSIFNDDSEETTAPATTTTKEATTTALPAIEATTTTAAATTTAD